MASVLNNNWKQELMKGTTTASLNGSGTTGVYAVLVDAGAPYTSTTFNTHTTFSQLSGTAGAVITATPVELTSKTFGVVSAGTFDAGDITFPSVPTAASAEAIVLYVRNAGVDATGLLVAYIDGISVTPNGGNITVTWSGSGIFTL